MFDNKKYEFVLNFDTASQKSKIKQILFDLAKDQFSDTKQYKLRYYACVNESLKNEKIEGKDLDKAIVQCKFKLQQLEKYVKDTNQHAAIKVRRCIKSKRE